MHRGGPCPRMIEPSAIVGSLSWAWPIPAVYFQARSAFGCVPTRSVTAIKLSTNGVQGLPCEVPNYL